LPPAEAPSSFPDIPIGFMGLPLMFFVERIGTRARRVPKATACSHQLVDFSVKTGSMQRIGRALAAARRFLRAAQFDAWRRDPSTASPVRTAL
jgi:hypothetical protein